MNEHLSAEILVSQQEQRDETRCGGHYRLRISIPARTAGDPVSRKSLAK